MDLHHHFAVAHQQRLLATAERYRAGRRPSPWLRLRAAASRPTLPAVPQATPCPTC